MVARCNILLGENHKEIESNIEGAISNYQRSKLPDFATRVVFLYYDYLASKKLFREASPILIRSTSEVPPLFPSESVNIPLNNEHNSQG